MNNFKTWYIQYDHNIFETLNSPNASNQIFKVILEFQQYIGPQPEIVNNIPEWIGFIGQAAKQIILLIYNFFYVQAKLTDRQNVKIVFMRICHIFKTENQYSKHFFVRSENFRTYRITASCLRLNKFLDLILQILSFYKKILDKTFQENFDQVIIYIQKKIKQTLAKLQAQKDHQISLILLDMLSLILRNSGDNTMGRIIDKTLEKTIQQSIQKNNQIYEEYGRNKQAELIYFQQNKYFQIDQDIEQDPNKKINESSIDQNEDQ